MCPSVQARNDSETDAVIGTQLPPATPINEVCFAQRTCFFDLSMCPSVQARNDSETDTVIGTQLPPATPINEVCLLDVRAFLP